MQKVVMKSEAMQRKLKELMGLPSEVDQWDDLKFLNRDRSFISRQINEMEGES